MTPPRPAGAGARAVVLFGLAAALVPGAAVLAVALVVAVSTGAAGQPPASGCGAQGGPALLAGVTLDAEQMTNAGIIVRTVAALGPSAPAAVRAAVIAVAAARTESGLRNLPGGDRDSRGLFQIRTGLHGSAVAADPVLSTRWFLTELAGVPDWPRLSVNDAAAAVERPAAQYRDRYGAAEALAVAVVSVLWPAAAHDAAVTSAGTPAATSAVISPVTSPVTSAATSVGRVVGAALSTASGVASPASATASAAEAGAAPPRCPQGAVADGAAAGAPTAGLPCPQPGPPGSVEQGPGGVPIRLCPVGTWQVNASLAPQVQQLLDAARAAGLDLAGASFRSYASQVALRRAHCGPTRYDLYDRAPQQCAPPTARPGTSMHEWGLALDITDHGVLLTSHTDRAWLWLADHAAAYGLHNLSTEPWHWSSNGN